MDDVPNSNGGRASGPSRLTGKEWLLLLVLGSVQFTHILDFMIVMPLGPHFLPTNHERLTTLGAEGVLVEGDTPIVDDTRKEPANQDAEASGQQKSAPLDANKMLMTPKQFGFMVSAYAFSACITGLLAAWFIDRFDRKRALLVLYAGFAVGTLLCACAPNYALLVLGRIVAGGFGGVVNAVVLTIVGDLFHDSRRGRAMGVLMSAFSLASIAGVPVGLILADALGWQAPFAVLGVGSLGILSMVFIVLPPVRGHLGRNQPNVLRQFLAVLLDPGHLRAYALMSFLVLGMFTIVPFMATYLVVNVGCAETNLKYMYLCGGLVTLGTMQFAGWLADRFSKMRMFQVLAVLTVVPILLITNLPRVSLPVMLACTTLFMAVTSARMVPLMALVTACAQPRLRGSFMSVNASVQQLAMAVAAEIASLLIHQQADGTLTGFAIVGVIAAVTTLLCAVFVGFLRPAVIHAVETDMAGHVLSPVHSNGIRTTVPAEIVTAREDRRLRLSNPDR